MAGTAVPAGLWELKRVGGWSMNPDKQQILELLKFELKFPEDDGYGRSPHTPWHPQLIFEDSPSCLNFGDPDRPHPCSGCWLMNFVPEDDRKRVHLADFELEEAMAGWLRRQIRRIEDGGYRSRAGPG